MAENMADNGTYAGSTFAQKLTFFSIWAHLSWNTHVQKIAIFLKIGVIYNRNSIVTGQKHGRYADIWPDQKLQKIAKNWHFFEKKADLRLFWAIYAEIMGQYRQIGGFENVQKIAIFFKIQPHFNRVCIVAGRFHGTYAGDVSPDVKPLGQMAVAQKLQKIALFLEKMLKIGGFETFWPKSWDICEVSHVPKFVRQTAHTHVYAQVSAHNARSQPRADRRSPAQGRIRAERSARRSAGAALRTF